MWPVPGGPAWRALPDPSISRAAAAFTPDRHPLYAAARLPTCLFPAVRPPMPFMVTPGSVPGDTRFPERTIHPLREKRCTGPTPRRRRAEYG
ncbi:hypothetical protein FRAHR75_1330015 [Frankia sp. Hr75.2]|nr:hypothetical protein FRAHR75_1330015 [Frankia sp. Hr75.2]SQD98148.1 hypothetical protein FMEAI12_4540009 [Parafrankia sp. Ea1.12]SQD98169.1 hypothetical protein FMEAI12_4540030 [Parafrankia sp. Ea1.12]